MKILLPPSIKSSSFYVMGLLIMILIVFRIITLHDNELSWDVLGYYIHLPAFFIYKDHGLSDLGWIHQLLELYPLTGTLYQISTGPDGNPIFFFLMGMSFFYLPWFLVGHLMATFSGYPADGFSLPYQYSLAIGAISYTIIGLVYLRKILLNFFNDRITSIVLIIIVLGTNYFHFLTVKNLETANILFLMVTLIIWNTMQWHKNFSLKNLISLSVFIVLTALAKPSEVLVVLIPLLWGVYNKETLNTKINIIKLHYRQFLIAIFAGVLIALPQMIYWYLETGFILYDSYKNPGVGLDLLSPHIINVLFSFKKGWFIYTPVMIFSVIGFFYLYKKNKEIFAPLLIYVLIAFYILSSWTEWWYGASYSIRPMITLYPILAISTGYFLEHLFTKRTFNKILISTLMLFFIVLNLFQTWQLNNYIIEPYRMTRDYYFAIFGKTTITDEDRKLLAPDLAFNESSKIQDKTAFRKRNFGFYDFEDADVNLKNNISYDSINGLVLRMDSTLGFSPEIRTTYRGLTDKDYVYINAKVDILIPEGFNEELPVLVLTLNRKEGNYHYRSYAIDTNVYKPGSWGKIEVEMMTPHIRSSSDYFLVYVWNRSKSPVYIDNMKADAYEPL